MICIFKVFFFSSLLCGRTEETCSMVNSLRKVDFSHPTGHYTWTKFRPPLEKILGAPLPLSVSAAPLSVSSAPLSVSAAPLSASAAPSARLGPDPDHQPVPSGRHSSLCLRQLPPATRPAGGRSAAGPVGAAWRRHRSAGRLLHSSCRGRDPGYRGLISPA